MIAGIAFKTNALSIDRIRRDLSTNKVGCHLYLFEEVPSTSEVLRTPAKAGALEGTVVLAESQTAGRGRLGKVWYSPPEMNLYASVLFRPSITPQEVPGFSFLAGVALADAVKEEGVEPAIKWPNDILVGRRKVAGTLVECATVSDRVEYVILGVGVNLNVGREALLHVLGEAGKAATSLSAVTGREINRNAFAARFLTLLDEWYEIYLARGARVLLDAWRDRDIVTGRRVVVLGERERYEGKALGVGANGYLMVEDPRGSVRQVVTGEVRLLD
ncbi:MAG: biotin--[acetyl-CoA-carboxylase] ligase [Candidatus Methylomirabilia bacterium]